MGLFFESVLRFLILILYFLIDVTVKVTNCSKYGVMMVSEDCRRMVIIIIYVVLFNQGAFN
jgi:hypothetical protein